MSDLVQEARAAATAGVPLGREQGAVYDELAAPLEEVEQRGLAVSALEHVLRVDLDHRQPAPLGVERGPRA
jgi:hypothetical protein